ncbi:MAG TPA: DinB family protein [Longimicrobiales bacterium]|nr:DinB family protein [Longimicrobiales bacterium]
MTRLDELRELFRFNRWAEERMFEATGKLSEEELNRDLGNSFPSVRETLLHIVGAEWVWLTRWKGTSPTEYPRDKRALTHPQIFTWWRSVDSDRDAFVAGLTEADVDRLLEYTNFAGKNFSFPFWQMFRHVVNHSSYHRGEITTMLRQLGHKPVSTDMILLYQEEFLKP